MGGRDGQGAMCIPKAKDGPDRKVDIFHWAANPGGFLFVLNRQILMFF